MCLRFWEVRSAVLERVLSVESDSETLGRASRKREKTSGRGEIGSIVAEYRFRYFAGVYGYALRCGKTERCARASTLASAIATARGGSVMRTTPMLCALTLRAGHRVGVVMTRRSG